MGVTTSTTNATSLMTRPLSQVCGGTNSPPPAFVQTARLSRGGGVHSAAYATSLMARTIHFVQVAAGPRSHHRHSRRRHGNRVGDTTTTGQCDVPDDETFVQVAAGRRQHHRPSRMMARQSRGGTTTTDNATSLLARTMTLSRLLRAVTYHTIGLRDDGTAIAWGLQQLTANATSLMVRTMTSRRLLRATITPSAFA